MSYGRSGSELRRDNGGWSLAGSVIFLLVFIMLSLWVLRWVNNDIPAGQAPQTKIVVDKLEAVKPLYGAHTSRTHFYLIAEDGTSLDVEMATYSRARPGDSVEGVWVRR